MQFNSNVHLDLLEQPVRIARKILVIRSIYYLPHHEVVVAGNVLMLETISARYCSCVRYLHVCLSVCLSARRRRYVVLRITLLFIYLKHIFEYFWKKIFYRRDVFPGIQPTARMLYFMLYIKVPCTCSRPRSEDWPLRR